jgi:hypothetical protein
MPPETDDLPGVEELFQAADDHADANGEFDYAVGDLQEILRAAWRLMKPEPRMAPFAEPELVALGDLPEYEPLIGRLVRPA